MLTFHHFGVRYNTFFHIIISHDTGFLKPEGGNKCLVYDLLYSLYGVTPLLISINCTERII